MKKLTTVLCCCLTVITSYAQLKISHNQRYLMKDGKPFFWLGDTAWELFHRLNAAETDQYLKHRSEQGFTVIQAVLLAEFDGLRVPNANGDLPLKDNNPETPDEAYFRHVDQVIDKAAAYGLVIGLLPTWGDKVWKSTWGKGPEVFTPQNARVYGRWLGKRYGQRKNIVWITGGDRTPQNDTHVAIWREMATGILEGAGNDVRPVMTFHPQPTATGSAQWFHNDAWLSFNMFQNGHCRNTAVYDRIQSVYNKTPVKPVIDGEPIYEDHPVCFNAKDLGTSNAHDVRMYAYLDLFAGAFGHTYGCHDIWQFYAKDREAVNNPHTYWQEAMDLPAAQQMKHVRKLMEAGPMLDRIPDQSFLAENNNAAAERIQATRGNDYIYVYTCAGKPFTLTLGVISGSSLQCGWFNPRDGKYKALDTIPNTGQQRFNPPSSGYGQDWVLVLQDVNRSVTL